MKSKIVSPASVSVGRLICAFAVPLVVGTALAQPSPEETTGRLRPVTLPVRQVHRDPNAVAPSCPGPAAQDENTKAATAGPSLDAPFVYPAPKGVTLVRSSSDLPDKRVRSMPSTRGGASPRDASVALVSAVITGSTPSDCNPPAAKVQFATTDQGNIYAFASINGGTIGDTVRWDWYAPDGTLSFTNNLNVQFNGASCFWSWTAVSDAAKKPGAWTVKIFYQNSQITTLTFTIGAARGGGCSSVAGKICRDEISLFYQGAHSLGTAWVRAVFEPTFPGPLAISQIQASLDNLVAGLSATPCIPYDLSKIASLRAAVPTLPSQTIIDRIGALIPDIQLAIRNAALPCDGGANFESLYVVGVDLGASIAEAIGFMYNDPLSPAAITFITTLMTNASTAMANYVPCSNAFTPVMLAPGNFDLANPLVLVPLTQLIGTYNLIVWNISLSCCCCTCGAAGPAPNTDTTGTISGVVRNASTGAVLPGVTVSVSNTNLTTKTGNDGSYTISNVPAGARSLQASLQGFVTTNVNVTVAGGQTVTQNLSLSPVLQSSGEIRITLNWNRTNGVPNDLDMHLVAPQSDGTCYEVYYANQGSATSAPFAQLEADNIDVSGDPPLETIHITKLTPGTYTLFIHHYSSNNGEATNAMAASRAAVQVFTQAGTVFNQVIPSTSGIYWDVLRINGSTGAITGTNTVGGQAPSSSCH